jgi:hypothetical protein
MKTINRQAFRVIYKEPFTHWIRTMPDLPAGFDLGASKLNAHPTVYLIDLQEDDPALDAYFAKNKPQIFESLLAEWVDDPELWPGDLSSAEFDRWFEMEAFDMVKDFSLNPIESDEFTNNEWG